MKKIFFLLFFLFLLTQSAFTRNYLWPTNASTYLSSGFCEYRPGHYHAALDIKTWNQEGYKCFAIADGTIERIRVSPFGYGKVLYLKLDDGNKAVYAHLRNFPPNIEKEIRAMQLSDKKYRIDYWPGIPVKKGEVIAYTGSTGTGVAHLHFEIRDQNDHPVNPLKFYPRVKDHIRPRMLQVAVIPLSEHSTVNGSHLPQIFDISYVTRGVNIVRTPIYARGRIGLALKGFDLADDVYNKLPFYETSMNINGKEHFYLKYDTLYYSQTSYIDDAIYYPLRRNGDGEFFKIYTTQKKLPHFYKDYDDRDGTYKVNNNPVEFEITARDYFNNFSILKIEIKPEKQKTFTVLQKKKFDGWGYITLKSPVFKTLDFSSSSDFTNWNKVDKFEIRTGQMQQEKNILFAKVKLVDSLDNAVRIEYPDNNGQNISKIINLNFSNQPDTIDYCIRDKFLILHTNKEVASVFIEPGNIYRNFEGRNQIAISARHIISDSLSLFFTSDNVFSLQKQLNIYRLLPDREETYFSPDSLLALTTSTNSLFDTTLIEISSSKPDSFLTDSILLYGNIFNIYPDNIALHKSIRIFIKTGELPANGNWGLFKTRNLRNFGLVSAQYDSLRQGFHGRTGSFGTFAVVSDTVPPAVEIISPVMNASYRANPQIEFLTGDDLAGIGHESDISITIDDQFVLPEWDPEEDIVTAKIDQKLTAGLHKLKIDVKDNLDNKSTKIIEFTIK